MVTRPEEQRIQPSTIVADPIHLDASSGAAATIRVTPTVVVSSVVAPPPRGVLSRILGRGRCEACGTATARRRDTFCSAACASTFHLYE
ncbi:hypothetical protein [Rathayibacter tanaceti]|uniref:hypothetical protein n=1 Tax=Rathayibacter tanaceti TaxID=1671680 RepID=UPI001290088A|nr:hypothetical protein [Rathayibacter tanaceti]